MAAVDEYLVDRDAGLIKLLDPPFDKSSLEPGYIKGYVPGVRENGGQYTHAAIWVAMAFALQGDVKRAWELFSMLNPINHAAGPEDAELYKVEPYVMTADIYAAPPHVGRGGWSWYTGAAGWMYKLAVETLVGLHLEVDRLRLTPRVPAEWESYKIHYRYRETFYHITVARAGRSAGAALAEAAAEQRAGIPAMALPAKAVPAGPTEWVGPRTVAPPAAVLPGVTVPVPAAVPAPLETVTRIVVDGAELIQSGDSRGTIPLVDDRRDHFVEVELGGRGFAFQQPHSQTETKV